MPRLKSSDEFFKSSDDLRFGPFLRLFFSIELIYYAGFALHRRRFQYEPGFVCISFDTPLLHLFPDTNAASTLFICT